MSPVLLRGAHARRTGNAIDLAPRLPVPVGAVLVLSANALLLALVLAGLASAALAVALVVPVGVALVRRPQRGVLLVTALAPFNGLLLVVAHPVPAEWWKELLVLLTLAATFVSPVETRGRAGRPMPPWLLAVAGLVAVGTASAAVVGGLQGLAGLKITFFFLLLAYAVWRCPLSGPERDQLVTILMATGVLTAGFGLVQQVLGGDRLAGLGWEYNSAIRFAGGRLRSFSTFDQPFPFAFFLMLVLLVGVSQLFQDPRRLRNQLFALALPILALALLSTFVRGAWLGLAIGLAYLGSSRYRPLLLLIPVAAVTLLMLPTEVVTPALSSDSSQERVSAWDQNLAAIVEHPLGVGLGSSGAAAEFTAEALGDRRPTFQPDNYYFKTTYELGILGLWLLGLLLATAFVSARDSARSATGADAALAAAAAAMALAVAGASLVASYFEIFPMDLYFWVLVSIVAGWDHGSHSTHLP